MTEIGSPSPDADLPQPDGALQRVLSAATLVDAVREAASATLAPHGIRLWTAVFRTGDELRELAGLRDVHPPLVLSLGESDSPLAQAWAAALPIFRHAAPLADGDEFPAAWFTLRGPDGVFGALLAEEGPAPGLDAAADAVRALAPALCARWQAHAAREALEASERRGALYGGICDALADPVLVTDGGNRILLENRRARSLFQARAGDGDERLHRVKVNNFLFTAFLARLRPAETEARELTLVDPDTGEELLFEALPAPLPARFAVPAEATVSLLRDVTELRRAGNQLGHQVRRVQMAEARARSERDQLNLILAHVGAPIVVTDPRGAVMMMNREAQRLFRPGGAPGEAPGAATVANADRFFAALDAFSSAGQAEQVTRVALRDPDSGAELPAELVTGVIHDGDGATLAVVSILHDLTQEVENARLAAELARVNEGLEQSIREATGELQEQNRQLAWQGQELERAYRHKSEFLASMSHELRTPINALLGYTALLRERIYGDLTPRQDEALQRMQSSSGHLLELVNDILDLARIEAGRMPVHLEAVLLGPLVESVVDSVEPQARAKGLALVMDVPADLPALITDRTRVKQVVLNLLSNAVKFTRDGSVTLTARPLPSGDGVEVSVADTGIGIAPEALAGIFEDFRQVDQSSTREFGGTGLGLSIVRKLLGLLGGSIRVESQPSVGSTFTVTLPYRSPEVAEGEDAIRRAMRGSAAIVRDGREETLPPAEPLRVDDVGNRE